jgi:hypothetical protein
VVLRRGRSGEAAAGAPPAAGGGGRRLGRGGCGGGADLSAAVARGGGADLSAAAATLTLSFFPLSCGLVFLTCTVPVVVSTVATGDRKLASPHGNMSPSTVRWKRP